MRYPAIKKPTKKPNNKAAKPTRPPDRLALPFTPPTSVDGQLGISAGLNHKLRAEVGAEPHHKPVPGGWPGEPQAAMVEGTHTRARMGTGKPSPTLHNLSGNQT